MTWIAHSFAADRGAVEAANARWFGCRDFYSQRRHPNPRFLPSTNSAEN
jgi:hypothetical protein